MAERVPGVPFAEVDTMRLTCTKCGDVSMEFPIDTFLNATLICPGCGIDLRKRPGIDGDLRQSANGLIALRNQKEIGIGFVLSQSDE